MQLKRRSQAGDTLVEVLLAFTIFGMAATTIIRTMNDGFTRMSSSGQQSQIQSLMRGQAAIIQAAHNAEVKDPGSTTWDTLIEAIAATPADRQTPVNGDGCTYTANKTRLYFDTDTNVPWTGPESRPALAVDTKVAADTVTPEPNGIAMWVEAKYTRHGALVNGKTNNGRGYYDFYTKACWSDGRVDRQLKTVTRLYELLPAPGEGSPVTATPPPPPSPAQVSLNGSQYIAGRCVPQNPLTNDSTVPAPTYPPYSSPNATYPCAAMSGYPQSVYSCSNYDVGYRPNVPAQGNYRLTIAYQDAICGGGPETLGAAYSYKVAIYNNGTKVADMNLPADGGTAVLASMPLTVGTTNEITLRWWNNHWITTPTGNKDPDLVFMNLTWTRVP